MQLTNSILNKTTTTKLHIEWNDYFNISLLVWIFENNGLLIDTGSSNLYLKKLGANSITMMYMRNMRIMQSKPNTILHNNANVSHKYELCVLHIILQHLSVLFVLFVFQFIMLPLFLHYGDVIMGAIATHQPHGCSLKRLFRRRSRKTSKLRVTGFCVGNSPVPGGFPAQMASKAENVSILWRHHVMQP